MSQIGSASSSGSGGNVFFPSDDAAARGGGGGGGGGYEDGFGSGSEAELPAARDARLASGVRLPSSPGPRHLSNRNSSNGGGGRSGGTGSSSATEEYASPRITFTTGHSGSKLEQFNNTAGQREESSTDGPASPRLQGPGGGGGGGNDAVQYAELATPAAGKADTSEVKYASLELHASTVASTVAPAPAATQRKPEADKKRRAGKAAATAGGGGGGGGGGAGVDIGVRHGGIKQGKIGGFTKTTLLLDAAVKAALKQAVKQHKKSRDARIVIIKINPEGTTIVLDAEAVCGEASA